jgi:hypothetical protein
LSSMLMNSSSNWHYFKNATLTDHWTFTSPGVMIAGALIIFIIRLCCCKKCCQTQTTTPAAMYYASSAPPPPMVFNDTKESTQK